MLLGQQLFRLPGQRLRPLPQLCWSARCCQNGRWGSRRSCHQGHWCLSVCLTVSAKLTAGIAQQRAAREKAYKAPHSSFPASAVLYRRTQCRANLRGIKSHYMCLLISWCYLATKWIDCIEIRIRSVQKFSCILIFKHNASITSSDSKQIIQSTLMTVIMTHEILFKQSFLRQTPSFSLLPLKNHQRTFCSHF